MNSGPERNRKVKELCNRALDLEPRERGAFLDEACGGDDDLRREVESLLSHEQSVAGFLAQPAWQHVVRDMAIGERESLAGRQLDRYQIHERLGEGGMGEVWQATDQQLKREVAIKILPREFSADPERVRRFEHEAYAVSALKHANIITIHEIGHSGDLHFIVTELVEGQTLRDRLARGPLGWREAVRVAAQIAGGLSAAHTAGIIHRDIKPENVIVQSGGHVKVLDFGIAKWIGVPTSDAVSDSTVTEVQTRMGATPGTLKYMSPEQARGKKLDPRTDVFSLGVVLYEMVAGRHPYGEMSEQQVIAALKSEDEVPPVRAGGLAIPAALDRILTKALQKKRDQRYASAGEMLPDLDELKSLTEVSRQEKGQKVFRTQNANQLLTQFAVLYDADKNTRLPLGALWTIWRFSDLKRGRLERETIRKSLVSGLTKVALLVLLAAAITTAVAAVKSVNEVWEEKVMRDGHAAAALQAVFSPDGRLLVSVGEDHQVIVWDFARRERLKTFTDHTGRVNSVAFSPNGKWFATGSDDKTVIVWDAIRLVQAVVLREHQGSVTTLAFSSDGQLLASSSIGPPNDSGLTVLWEAGRWEKVLELPACCGSGYGNQLFLRGNRWLAEISGRMWNLNTRQMVRDKDPDWGGNWAAISPDGTRWVSVDGDGDVKFVDLTRQKFLGVQHAHYDHGRSVAFSPDGRWLATAAERVILWDAATMTKIAPLEYESIVWNVAFSPDGRWLVSTHGDGAILVWDVLQRERVANLREHSGGVRAVAFSPDGKRVASASEDQSVIVWKVESGRKEAVLIGHHTRVTAVTFSPDNQWLASADQDGSVIRWNVAQRLPQWTIKASEHHIPGYCLTISPDGRWIATTHGAYDSESGRRVVDLITSGGHPYGAAFTADGRRLVCVTDSSYVLLWDAQKWQLIERQQWANAGVISVSLSPDGKYLATGDDERLVRLGTIEPLRQLAVLGQHEARIKSVAFSPDSSTVASAGDDKMIALWDVNRSRLITQIGTHTSPVYAIAFSPDGKQLISGEHDRSVRVYTRHRTLWGFRLD